MNLVSTTFFDYWPSRTSSTTWRDRLVATQKSEYLLLERKRISLLDTK